MYIITDWAAQIRFDHKKFKTFEKAEDFLCNYFDQNEMDYDEWRGEYEIIELTPKHNTSGNMLRNWN